MATKLHAASAVFGQSIPAAHDKLLCHNCCRKFMQKHVSADGDEVTLVAKLVPTGGPCFYFLLYDNVTWGNPGHFSILQHSSIIAAHCCSCRKTL